MNRKLFACLAVLALALVATSADAGSPYTISLSSPTVAPGSSVDLDVTIDSSAGSDLAGWSYGVCSDPAALAVTGVSDGPAVNAFDDGDGPGFNEQAIFADGYTKGIVICITGCEVLPPQVAVLSTGTYDNLMPDGGTTSVTMCDTLGTPPVAAVVVENGLSVTPIFVNGTVTSFAPPVTPFVRGDGNNDGTVNIADGIYMLNNLFQGGPGNDCAGANDSNSDANFDASDAIFIFGYQFLDGPAPAAPFPDCGLDGDPDPADCASSSCP